MTESNEIINTAKLERIEYMVEDMHHRLFGNGQPGFVEKSDERLKELESYRSFIRGAAWVIGGLFTLLTGVLTYHIARGLG